MLIHCLSEPMIPAEVDRVIRLPGPPTQAIPQNRSIDRLPEFASWPPVNKLAGCGAPALLYCLNFIRRKNNFENNYHEKIIANIGYYF